MLKDIHWNPTSAKFEMFKCHTKSGEMELNHGIFCYQGTGMCVHVLSWTVVLCTLREQAFNIFQNIICVHPFHITMNQTTFSQLLSVVPLLPNDMDYVTYKFLELTFWKTKMFRVNRYNAPWIHSTDNTVVTQYVLHLEWQFLFYRKSLPHDQVTKDYLNSSDNLINFIPQLPSK
jgi:hypothetical protein